MDMSKFENVKGISTYNHNFYRGLDNELLYALSDDDNETEWYLFNYFNVSFVLIGYSYVSGDEKLQRTDTRRT